MSAVSMLSVATPMVRMIVPVSLDMKEMDVNAVSL